MPSLPAAAYHQIAAALSSRLSRYTRAFQLLGVNVKL